MKFVSFQVANFIVKNSEPTPILNAGSQYVDPFTGENRYVPGSGTLSSTPDVSAQSSTFNSSNTSASPSYIPHSRYLKFEQANLTAILGEPYLR